MSYFTSSETCACPGQKTLESSCPSLHSPAASPGLARPLPQANGGAILTLAGGLRQLSSGRSPPQFATRRTRTALIRTVPRRSRPRRGRRGRAPAPPGLLQAAGGIHRCGADDQGPRSINRAIVRVVDHDVRRPARDRDLEPYRLEPPRSHDRGYLQARRRLRDRQALR